MILKRIIPKFVSPKSLEASSSSSSSAAVATNAENATNWDIGVAVAIYRLPLIAPPLSPIEKEFMEMSHKIEHERFYRNDFELRLERDKILLDKRKKLEMEGKDLSELDFQIGISSFFVQDEWNRLARETVEEHALDDRTKFESKDERSPRRKLDRKLFLVTKQYSPSSPDHVLPWQLPFLMNDGSESLRETVERCTKGGVFATPKKQPLLTILGNTPVSHFKYRYPKKLSDQLGKKGAILFLYACQLVERRSLLLEEKQRIPVNKSYIANYKWCTVEELKNLIPSRRYKNALKPITLE